MEQPTPLVTVPSGDPIIKHGWIRALLFLPTHIIGTVLVSLIVLFIIGFNFHDYANYDQFLDQPKMMLLNLAMLIWTISITYGFRTLIDNRSFLLLGFAFSREWFKDFVAGILLGAILMTALFLIALYLGAVTVTGWHFPIGTLAVMAFNLLCAGAIEEITLRGYFLNNMMQSTNKYLALIFTSAIFSVAHGLNPNFGWISLLNIFLAGLLLGIYYVHKQNLWFPIGLHLSWNFFQGPVFGSPVSGVKLDSVFITEYGGSDYLTGGEFGFEASLAASIVTLGAILLLHFNYRPKKLSS